MEIPEIKLFNKYSFEEVVVSDPSLAPYLNVAKKEIVPHSCSRKSLGHFGKIRKTIVEWFVTRLMKNGRNTGKKRMSIRHFESACEIIAAKTKKNPIQVFVDAVIIAGPREISARVGKGGNTKRTSVDISAYKRVSKALIFLTDGMRKEAFKNKKVSISEAIAHELINAANNSQSSYAVKKKEETERIAKSNR